MARVGVTLDAVYRAREALIARGESVSIDAIRIELGNTGSKSTLHKHLRTLEQAEADKALRPALSDELAYLIAGVAQRLEEEGNRSRDELRLEFDEASANWSAQQREYEQCIAQLEQDNEELHARNGAICEDKATLENELREANHSIKQDEKELAIRLSEISLLTQHNASLESKHEDARDALEHYRESVKQQRMEERARFDNEVATLKQSIRDLQLKLTEKESSLTSMNSVLIKLETECKHTKNTLDQLSQSHSALKCEHNILDLEYVKVKERLGLQLQHNSALKKNIAVLTENVGQLKTKSDTLVAERQRMEGQISAQQKLIAEWMHKMQIEVSKKSS